MKILHLLYESRGDPFGIGGVGIRAYEIYRRIQERHDVTLLCRKYPGARDGKVAGLRHIFVGTESRSLTKTLLSYAYHASRFVQRHGLEYDIIIEEYSPAIPTFYQRSLRTPVVLQVQGYTGILYFRKYNLFYAVFLFLSELLRTWFYTNFIFINHEMMEKFYLKREKHSAVIPNGISSQLLDIPDDEMDYILYIGRIDVYGKGLDILLDAYGEFFQSFPEIRLVIAGDGRDRERFQSMLMKLPEGIRKNIEMPGWISDERKGSVFSKAVFVVFPSRHEAQPIAVLEAMGSGKAVLVSDLPEFRFVKDTGAGTEFKAGDARSLVQAMKELVTHGERKEMGQRGREWVKHYLWDNVALKYEGFLYEIAGQAESRGTCRGEHG
jgi:glycosyltransferase involved in cell wall biosynthesis